MKSQFNSFFESGSHLLSHIVSNAVPSAAYVLTVVFGMGTGVSHKRIATGSFFIKSYLNNKTIRQPLLILP